ncbi:zinc-binding dehydrogenase [Streptomyces luteogriseus]|uniref:zinc-binding dehydrogenase n=1 Tax=Streptomyces luteogriseus TaxID=68233 RepID=UPI0037F11103
MAAPMLCAGYTGWSALRAGEPQPHERVAVLGIGAVGHLAVQFAHACGHETIAMTSSPDNDVVRRLGADEVVASGAELRAAGGADVILATSKSYAAAAEALTGLRPGGRLVLSGIDPTTPFTVPPAGRGLPFIGTRMKVVGSTHNGPQYLREALDLAAAGKVAPMVETFPKEEVATVVDRVAKGAVRFRAVVTY